MIKATQENFEGLMRLTNLISIGENVRKHILREDEFSNIKQHIFEEYSILRRTTIECMCNLIIQKESLSKIPLSKGTNASAHLVTEGLC
ncbi:unnamed protein product [Rotaria sordida]|uniref:Uncharacterized protein n=2 Tax=Rotaria sordida TaxID=392033 RepID=A0A814VKQ7_9BILA|nr:unnamed protein product [Rotaria sordida]CAF1210315.1 unnamed protein product [Rotaria sordida]